MKTFFALLLFFGLAQSPVLAAETAEFVTRPATKALLQQLRAGGYVLYMRHGNTDSSRPDRAPQVDLNDCSTQRPLTEDGRRQAQRVGDFMRKAGLPFGDIYSSPLCRAKESAQAAFGDRFQVDGNLMYTGNMTSEEKVPTVQRTRELLSQPVAAGRNRIIVSHAPNLVDLFGYFPKPEGTVVVIKPASGPNGAGFEYVASIFPEQWPDLLK